MYKDIDSDIKGLDLKCPECPTPSCPACPSVNKECPKCPDVKCPENQDCPPCNCPESKCPPSVMTQYPTKEEIAKATLNEIFPGRDSAVNSDIGFPVSAFGATSCPYAYPIDNNNLELINMQGNQPPATPATPPATPPASPPANPTASGFDTDSAVDRALDRSGFVDENGNRRADTPAETAPPTTESNDEPQPSNTDENP